MLRTFHFAFLFWAIFGSGYESQLAFNQNDLDLQKFVEENDIQMPGSDRVSNEEVQSAATSPQEGNGASPQAVDPAQVHHVIAAVVAVAPKEDPADCCKGASPQCMACREGLPIDIFCKDNPVVGCTSSPGPEQEEEKPQEKQKEAKEAPSKPEPTKCTIDIAENNQNCPMAKCASPEAIAANCKGKEWEAVKEIGNPATCCLKACNFRCITPSAPSHGTQNIVNTNALQPKEVPKENEMERLEYDKESKKIVKPAPGSADQKEEPKKVVKESKTVYGGKDGKKADSSAESKQVVKDPSVTLELFDSTITGNSFSFSYTIANVNPNGGYYWTVQRKDAGSLLASTVEKDGEESAPCSGYGKQGKETKTIDVNVECPFAAGKPYLLWFALDQDQKGAGVFLSPSEPIVVSIPMQKKTLSDVASTTMSAYGYSLMLNSEKKQKSPLKKIAEAEKKSEDMANKDDSESSPQVVEIHHIAHTVTVQKSETPEESEPKEKPEAPSVEQQSTPPQVVFQVFKKGGDEEERKEEESDKEKSSEQGEPKEDLQKTAEGHLKNMAKKNLSKKLEVAKETAKDAKEVLNDVQETKKRLSDKVEKADDEQAQKEKVKKIFQKHLDKAEDLTKRAQDLHAKAQEVVDHHKKKIEKVDEDGEKEAIKHVSMDDLKEVKKKVMKKVAKQSKNAAPSDMEEEKEKPEEKGENSDKDSSGKYVIGTLTNKGLTVACKDCPKKQKGGKLYYMMLHHQHVGEDEDGTPVIKAMQVYHTFLGDDGKDAEAAVSGGLDLDKAEKFDIKHHIPQGETFMLYLAKDADGKGKDLELIGEGIEVKAPENELSAESTKRLNKWRRIFFAFFLALTTGAILLSFRYFCSQKHRYQQVLLDFDLYDDEF